MILFILLAVWLVGLVLAARFLKSGPAIVGTWSWQSWILAAAWPLVPVIFIVWLVRDLFSSLFSDSKE